MVAPSCEPAALIRRGRDGVQIAVRLRPGGSADRIDGIETTADGRQRLKVRVKAHPEAGKANRALIKLLSKAWRLPAADVALVSGAKARDKVVRVRGRPEALASRLGAWLETL